MIQTKICPNCQESNRANATHCFQCNTDLAPVPIEARRTDELPLDAPLRQVPEEQRIIQEIIYQRYRVVSSQSAEAGTLYTTEDLCRCAVCGEELVGVQDRFCNSCGVEIQSHLKVDLLALDDAADTPDGLVSFEEDGTVYVVQDFEEPSAPQLPEPPGHGVRWQVGYQSDVGRVREVDEDSLLVLSVSGMLNGISKHALGCFVVADGMGGEAGGDVASRVVVRQIGRTILSSLADRALQGAVITSEEMANSLTTAVAAANKLVRETQREAGNEMGSTVTAALVLDTQAIIANVGDSRTYLWRDGQLEQITLDHSLVASLVAAGELEEDALYTDERRSVIYRSLGEKDDVEVDLFSAELAPNDRLILCCDGVWEPLRNEGIVDVMLETADPQQACEMMVERANATGGEDNISVIVVAVEAL